MINGFRGEYYFLSNFSPSKIEYEGYTYLNAEAAFHAQKNDSSTYKYLMQFQPPNTAKREGRKVKLREDWEEVKVYIMYDIVKAKFTQNENLKAKLLATGDKELVEANTWHDNYWGTCTCMACNGMVQLNTNNLGKVLMKVREELRNAL